MYRVSFGTAFILDGEVNSFKELFILGSNPKEVRKDQP